LNISKAKSNISYSYVVDDKIVGSYPKLQQILILIVAESSSQYIAYSRI